MNKKLQLYVGRIVCLNKHVFQEIKAQALRQGLALENRFVVAKVSRSLQKLICYGANFRIVVSASDVVLV